MSRILIEYQPFGLSTISKMLIRSTITASMIAGDSSTSQYNIDYIAKVLEENIEMMESDLKIINKLTKEGVSFIEI